ncbi:Mov34/MPN/PAD-1 family protein [Brevibacillus sp. DP1.3A]|uniref:Mov34/MPN/PAD-1 family protein n=1 Tax=unclassified Brevibacillus TaxID=2684853 RepID=UPI00156B8909|nr:Mov34/MPN/PAD-1 family protein [Brevibacillus sp. DP1.3A]MED1917128.1 Mov34/MPN/PAD-1 family protein [Bacillus thuringiensis]UED73258.1 Mov34/MPN/PAD-1 family protein [Brevibacillus sp. DP1.3A]
MTTLYITPKAWKQIEQAVRKKPSLETGGVMMGYPLGEDRWVVTYASEPGPNAIHQPHSIFFDDTHLNKLVRKLSRHRQWKYIGDWHSHTVKRLSPSKGDKRTIWAKASQSMYMSSSPLMLIVGLSKNNQINARGFILGNTLREVGKIELYDRQAQQQLGEKAP